MAKTYYKYKERGQQVDYAEISRNFSQGIMDTVTGIKKEADEFSDEVKAAQEAVKKDTEERVKEKRTSKGKSGTGRGKKGDYGIEAGEYDLPMGGERDANSVFVDLSTQAADRGLEFKRQLDSQKISDADYKQKRNALDRTFSVLKESAVGINMLAEETAAGLKDGTTDPTQQLAFQELMSYNFTDPRVKIEIGGDGVGFMYRVDDEGKELPKTRRTVSQLRNMALQRYDSYDFDGNATEVVTKLGKTLETLGRRGMTTEELIKREPIRNSVNGGVITPMNMIDDYANGLVDDDLASILMGQLGSKFKPTFNTEEQEKVDDKGNFYVDQSKILFVPQNLASGVNKKTAQLTDEQRERAIEFVKTDILSQFNVKPAAAYKPSASDIKAREGKRNAENTMNRMRDFFEGSTSEREEVFTTYIKETQGIIPKGGTFNKVEVIGDKLFIRYTDKERNPTEFPKGGIVIPDNLEDFVKTIGPVLTGNKDLHSLLKGSGVDFTSEKGKGTGDAAFEVGTEEYKGQNIIGYEEVIANVSDVLGNAYLNEGRRTTHAKQMANDFISKTGMKDVTVTEKNKVMTISTGDLGSITVDLKPSDSEQVKENLTVALKKLHDAVSQGKNLGGGTTDPNPEPANPFE